MGAHPTLISRNTRIVGDVHFTGELHIQGVVAGSIIAEGNSELEICQNGRVEGVIQVPKVIVRGTVEGDIRCWKHVELCPSANIQGNVFYHLIEVVKGAQVKGNLIYVAEAEKLMPHPPE